MPSLETPPRETPLIGGSPAITEAVETCVRVATSSATVLLLGETGTGKELLARAVHENSERPGDFVAVNCGSITETLIESELFGHEKGAFTGATEEKLGLFRRANRGTLLLDEIGSLPLSAQHSLLRVLQEGKVRPVGGSDELPVDVRVIAATSVPLGDAMARGEFREDLFYRLDVIRVVVPPLRNRTEDIRPLFDHFCAALSARHGVAKPSVSPGFESALCSYAWPGNVRQLENLAERLVLTRSGAELVAADLQEAVGVTGAGRAPQALAASAEEPSATPDERGVDLSLPLETFLEGWEREYLRAALRSTHGQVAAAAELAGMSRRTLSRKIKKYGLSAEKGHTRTVPRDPSPQEIEPIAGAPLWLSSPPLDPLCLGGKAERTIGRSPDCDLVIPYPSVSRVHARIRLHEGTWLLSDEGSRNGTHLNGTRITAPTPIANGDLIGIEPLRFRVTESADAPNSHRTTSTHLVSFQLDRVPLGVILETLLGRGHSAQLKVVSTGAKGTVNVLGGKVIHSSFSEADQSRLEGDRALHRLKELREGMCVVSSHNTRLVKRLLETEVDASDELEHALPDLPQNDSAGTEES